MHVKGASQRTPGSICRAVADVREGNTPALLHRVPRRCLHDAPLLAARYVRRDHQVFQLHLHAHTEVRSGQDRALTLLLSAIFLMGNEVQAKWCFFPCNGTPLPA